VHGGQDVTAGQGLGGAGGAVGDGDEVGEGFHDFFGVDVGEGEVDDVGDGAGLVAVELGVERCEGGEEAVAEGLVGGGALVGFGEGEFGGFAEACDEGEGEGAGAEAAFLSAAEGERCERGASAVLAAAGDERADAGGGVDLVAADADEVEAGVSERRDELAEALGGVGVEVGGVIDEAGGDLVDGLDDAGLVIHVHDGDEEGVVAAGGAEGGGVDESAGGGGDERDVEAAASEFFEGLEDGVVFDPGGDDVAAIGAAAFGFEAEEGEVVALRGAGGEVDVAAVGGDDGGDAVAGGLDGAAGALAEVVGAAAGVGEVGAHVAEDLVGHAGVEGGGGGAVEVDGHVTLHGSSNGAGLMLSSCLARSIQTGG